MLLALVLFAEGEGKAATDPAANPLIQMTPIFLIFLALWFIIILPAQRRERKQKESIFAALKKNDEVLTSSGIIGVVQNIRPDEDEISLRVDDSCKIRMKKSCVVQILKSKDSGDNNA